MAKISMVSLGCPKNLVDAEMMLEALKNDGYEITPYENEADVIIVNTCGFIEDAKREAIENILECANYKTEGNLKALVVTGCLAERYRDEIAEQFPEVDAVVGIGKNGSISEIVKKALDGEKGRYYGKKTELDICAPRMVSTPRYTAYIKIAEGCSNCCTYCAIPAIRGRFRSRPMESIVKEAQKLAANGVKELIVIAQDTTRYGEDIYGEQRLPELLSELCGIDGIKWIRTLYTYPDRIDDKLINTVAREPKLCKYFDIPIQHCNETVLRRMNRKGDRKSLTALMEKIRAAIPNVTLRTTLITGFPGETEEQFCELCEFVNEVKFDRLGCFPYSPEEGTPAADYPDQVDDQVKSDRAENIMNDQLRIVNEKNEAKIGSTVKVLVEGYDNYIKCWFGRSEADAPDIDGKVFFMSSKELTVGNFQNVTINDTIEYDLLGEATE